MIPLVSCQTAGGAAGRAAYLKECLGDAGAGARRVPGRGDDQSPLSRSVTVDTTPRRSIVSWQPAGLLRSLATIAA